MKWNKFVVIGVVYLLLIASLVIVNKRLVYVNSIVNKDSGFVGIVSANVNIATKSAEIKPSPEAKPQNRQILPEVDATGSPLIGLSSYYSVSGCLGCSENRTMANGERLDDSKLTVAYNRAPLNSFVVVKNIKTGIEVTAKVTDRGGFERHGKIIDLSVATKDAIGCGDVCKVEVKEI